MLRIDVNGTGAGPNGTYSIPTGNMTTGRKKLRLKFTQANGDVKVFPDLIISVQ